MCQTERYRSQPKTKQVKQGRDGGTGQGLVEEAGVDGNSLVVVGNGVDEVATIHSSSSSMFLDEAILH